MPRLLQCCLVPPLLFLFASCASYNTQVRKYYGNLRQGNLEKAAAALDNNKLLKKDRNHLLYLLERGKICHMMQQWDSSNRYLNEADLLMEEWRNTAKDVVAGTLLNPMMKRYRAEDFERYLVHYYKAINYLQLNQPDEALVEARRITLTENEQEDRTVNRDNYLGDPFSNILQGLIYERNNDINNAFIAYRNAADIYLATDDSYYGTLLPQQLVLDVLRTADANGFQDEVERYSKFLDSSWTRPGASTGGELVLFWENGSAPVKVQQDLYFALLKGEGGNFFFADPGGVYNIPFNSSSYGGDNIQLDNLRSFRVAIPRYEEQPVRYTDASVEINGKTYPLEQSENVNTLAFATLKQRMVKELAGTLARLAVKKLAEAAVRGKDDKDNSGKSAEQRKKDEKERSQREALALGLQLFNFATEKADTRNWQSLPHTIYYVRVPLNKGSNKVDLKLAGYDQRIISLDVTGNGNLQLVNVSTLGSALKD